MNWKGCWQIKYWVPDMDGLMTKSFRNKQEAERWLDLNDRKIKTFEIVIDSKKQAGDR